MTLGFASRSPPCVEALDNEEYYKKNDEIDLIK
jgi:hypothetical protein